MILEGYVDFVLRVFYKSSNIKNVYWFSCELHLHGSSKKKLQMSLLVDVLLVHKNKLSLLVGIRTLLFSRLINSNLPLIKKISRSNKMYSVSKQIFVFWPYTNIFKSLNSASNTNLQMKSTWIWGKASYLRQRTEMRKVGNDGAWKA